jgi:hypothetical protein
MGWKSTIDISRRTAIELIQNRLLTASNDQLSNVVECLGYGDDLNLDFYGHNFSVYDHCENEERSEYERLKRKFGD